ncbi:hypothetical protein FIBSPDRAFT_879752 [Athelia psychrophila]|uniref:Uncharacterized protein n=1 Tax=Athelia psychrophila TaxID=1759441 RepID=A0A167TM52_9AGAM|nr:hypothetical protein FIBSPDRAFT_879752 [Fibularhizoctonia sp. CBS 109695]
MPGSPGHYRSAATTRRRRRLPFLPSSPPPPPPTVGAALCIKVHHLLSPSSQRSNPVRTIVNHLPSQSAALPAPSPSLPHYIAYFCTMMYY